MPSWLGNLYLTGMGSLFTFNINNHVDLSQLEKDIRIIKKTLNNMATKEEIKAEFRAALDEIASATDNLAADIERLATQSENGISLADAGAFAAELREKASRLRGVADITPEPETPAP